MKTKIIPILLFFCVVHTVYSQTGNGAVALDLPLRNSLMFNRFVANPTFSFVREPNKYITLTNKRELVGLEDSPQTYFAGYSGRFGENTGAGIGFFQQDYGVFTTFGGVLNFAYNIQVQQDSNLTFAINAGAYNSGLNSGKVITNFEDPALNNIPSNFLLTASPSFNYGTGFMDFGITIQNAVTYNFQASGILKENPEQGIQGHIMYTGYLGGYGFFGESRFTALGTSEFQRDETIIAGQFLLTVPKGIWAQAGYNTVYGASAGLGVNITPQIAIEYNYEKAFMGLSDFGASHEITLAYRFKNTNYYDYSRDEELAGLFTPGNKRRKKKGPKKAVAVASETNVTQPEPEVVPEDLFTDTREKERIAAKEKAQEESNAQKPPTPEEIATQEAETQARIASEEKARLEAETQARIASEEIARQEAETQARIASEEKARQEAETQARIASEEIARQEAETQARITSEEKARQEAETQARIASEEKARQEAETQARIASEEKARQEAETQARIASEEKARQEAETQARIASEEKAIQEAETQARIASEEKARQEAETQARIASEEKAIAAASFKNPTDDIGQQLSTLTAESETSVRAQADLLQQLESAVADKQQTLTDLKKENDLGDQGIFVAPKPFKSITEENQAIETLKINLDTVILRQAKKIAQLEQLLAERKKSSTDATDETNVYFESALAILKSEQNKAIETRQSLVSSLEQIAVATAFERKRRIKRASYTNEEDRYSQDRARLASIKQNTPKNQTPLTGEDLDFGEERSTNIQILKNVSNTSSGYYLIVAVHNTPEKRDEFLTKVVASGDKNIDFFYDVNTSKYYLFTNTFSSIQEANRALNSKDAKVYNKEMSLLKIEN